jgi:superfamily I DNA and/or RNA helicase
MSPNAQRLLDEARQLPSNERDWLIENLIGEEGAMSDEAFAAWQKEAGDPEPGYEEWFRKGVEEALEDISEGVPHEEAMKHFHDAIQKARKLKRTA